MFKQISGVYSTITLNERANTEQYWRETIANEIRYAKNVDDAVTIALYGISKH